MTNLPDNMKLPVREDCGKVPAIGVILEAGIANAFFQHRRLTNPARVGILDDRPGRQVEKGL
jgi:hypothetical protein